MEKRTIVLIPREIDLHPSHVKYWENFVWHVRQKLENDVLDVRIVIAKPAAEGGTTIND